MLTTLQGAIGRVLYSWKGRGPTPINSNSNVHLGSPGTTGEPMGPLLLAHITGKVYVPKGNSKYLENDRIVLQEIGELLRSIGPDEYYTGDRASDLNKVWSLILSLHTKLKYYLRYLEWGPTGDLDDAWFEYEALCERLGEKVEYPRKST